MNEIVSLGKPRSCVLDFRPAFILDVDFEMVQGVRDELFNFRIHFMTSNLQVHVDSNSNPSTPNVSRKPSKNLFL